MPDFLLRDPLRDVARHGDRSVRDAVDRNESKGHLDIKFVPALVQRACQGRTSLKLLDGARHRVIEPAPVRRAKMLRHDQIENLPERLRGAEPTRTAPPRLGSTA